MSTPSKSPRSNYAARLGEFPEIILDAAAFSRRGMWNEFFKTRIGRSFNGRLVFEIGCFDADLLCHMAAKYPQTGFVGLDWKCKAIYDGAKRVTEQGLKNVALLRARAQDLSRIFADNEVDEILIFHPEPCDREVELKNRLVAEPFLIDVHRVLRNESSVLSLKTDHSGYYQWVCGLFDSPSSGDSLRRSFEMTKTSTDYWQDSAALANTADRCFEGQTTSFESRFIKKKQPIYFVEIRKKSRI